MEKIPHVLITGATSGIGLELASIAASKQQNLILLARNEVKMKQLKAEWEKQYGIQVIIFPCDLSVEGAVPDIARKLQSLQLVPDILINNAGSGLFGPFDQTDIERETEMIRVNITALTQLTKVIYRQMLVRGSGRILNVASVAGFMPGPLMSVYYASKAYVLSFSRALSNEAKGSGISVTVLCPGPTETNFESAANLSSSMLFKSFGKLPTARKVAEFAYKSMEKGKVVAIHGTGNRMMLFFVRIFPGKWITNMVRYVQRVEN